MFRRPDPRPFTQLLYRLQVHRLFRHVFLAFCDRLPMALVEQVMERRGWVSVPREYAEASFPKQLKSGWWPVIVPSNVSP